MPGHIRKEHIADGVYLLRDYENVTSIAGLSFSDTYLKLKKLTTSKNVERTNRGCTDHHIDRCAFHSNQITR